MNNCTDIYALSAIACKLAECLPEDELAVLATQLTALGDILQVLLAKQALCKKE